MPRIQVTRFDDPWHEPIYRLHEADGNLCVCWLPGIENPDPEGPLDCGGFTERIDATAFALGVDRERALFGLLTETVDDIDRERAKLDQYHAKPERLEVEDHRRVA